MKKKLIIPNNIKEIEELSKKPIKEILDNYEEVIKSEVGV